MPRNVLGGGGGGSNFGLLGIFEISESDTIRLKSSKKSLFLFCLPIMTICCKHLHRLELRKFKKKNYVAHLPGNKTTCKILHELIFSVPKCLFLITRRLGASSIFFLFLAAN